MVEEIIKGAYKAPFFIIIYSIKINNIQAAASIH